MAEILSVKHMSDGTTLYYIHYIDYNKRLDEWVNQDRLDLKEMQLPKKEVKSPLKNGSRPPSPEIVGIISIIYLVLIFLVRLMKMH